MAPTILRVATPRAPGGGGESPESASSDVEGEACGSGDSPGLASTSRRNASRMVGRCASVNESGISAPNASSSTRSGSNPSASHASLKRARFSSDNGTGSAGAGTASPTSTISPSTSSGASSSAEYTPSVMSENNSRQTMAAARQ